MKKLFVFIGLLFSLGSYAYADVMPPGYMSQHCEPEKIEVSCRYTTNIPFGPKVTNSCPQYQNNIKCEYLKGHGSSFGGGSVYCCDVGYETAYQSKIAPLLKIFVAPGFYLGLLLTLLLELPIFFLLKLREKRTVVIFTVANIISFTSFAAAAMFFGGLVFVVIAELLIALFEILFVTLLDKRYKKSLIFLAVVIANIISATLGSYILIFFNA